MYIVFLNHMLLIGVLYTMLLKNILLCYDYVCEETIMQVWNNRGD